MVRRTYDQTLAAKRLAEALGFEMESSGRSWRLRYEGKEWPSTMTGSEVLGRLVMIANSTFGFGMSYPDIWDLIRLDCLKAGNKYYTKNRHWEGGEIARMLKLGHEDERTA